MPDAKSSNKPGDESSSSNVGSGENRLPVAAAAQAAVGGDNISSTNNNDDNQDGDDMLLVTEFPPPPYYYTLASSGKLTPPDIPERAFRVAAKRVRQEKERARLESERIRLEAEKKDTDDDMVKEEGGGEREASTDAVMTEKQNEQNNDDNDDDSITDPNDPNEPIVAVFGEIVEDPTLVYVEEECNNPTILRDNVKRLNRSVLQGFLKLVNKLVNDPIENKKCRDDLSHNIFLMLQECNKFREHQAREILIATLEQQLEQREKGLGLLREQIQEAEDALEKMNAFQTAK